MRTLGLRIGTALILLAAPMSAAAGDGALEINQVCAAGPGCFPGDTAGFPVWISTPGSYRLTGSLQVPNAFTSAIAVLVSDVTLDLAGHEIRGVTTCSGTPTSCTPTGTGIGVAAGFESRVVVRNGQVRGMGSDGVSVGSESRVESISAAENGGNGIEATSGAQIVRNNAARNGMAGISANDGAVVRDNVAQSNGTRGISVDGNSVLTANTAAYNGTIGIRDLWGSIVTASSAYQNIDDGIRVGDGALVTDSAAWANGSAFTPDSDGIQSAFASLIQGNTTAANGGVGLRLSTAVGYRENVVSQNMSGTVTLGFNLGDNHCAGPGVVTASCP